MARFPALLGFAALLTACGSTTHAAASVTTNSSQAPETPICAFYGTTVAIGLLAMHPHDPDVTIARLRPRWPKVMGAAEQGASVHWREPAARETSAAYALFLADLERAGTAVDRGDMAAFQAAIRTAKTHLVRVDALAKRSHLTCKIVSPDGSTMTFGG